MECKTVLAAAVSDSYIFETNEREQTEYTEQ